MWLGFGNVCIFLEAALTERVISGRAGLGRGRLSQAAVANSPEPQELPDPGCIGPEGPGQPRVTGRCCWHLPRRSGSWQDPAACVPTGPSSLASRLETAGGGRDTWQLL